MKIKLPTTKMRTMGHFRCIQTICDSGDIAGFFRAIPKRKTGRRDCERHRTISLTMWKLRVKGEKHGAWDHCTLRCKQGGEIFIKRFF